MEVAIDELHSGAEIGDVAARYAADERPAPAGRPWVLLNMVASADGATAVDGTSGGLGSDADKAVLGAVRGVADAVLVAAGTVRAEGYGAPRPRASVAEARRARGQAPAPRLAIVTSRVDLDPAAAFFDLDPPTLVVTVEDAPADRLDALAGRAELVIAGRGRVDLGRALTVLGERVGPVVAAEGGPSLNAALFEADLVDEVCLTLSPAIVGGESSRLTTPALTERRRGLRLDRVARAGDHLFLRYLVDRSDAAGSASAG